MTQERKQIVRFVRKTYKNKERDDQITFEENGSSAKEQRSIVAEKCEVCVRTVPKKDWEKHVISFWHGKNIKKGNANETTSEFNGDPPSHQQTLWENCKKKVSKSSTTHNESKFTSNGVLEIIVITWFVLRPEASFKTNFLSNKPHFITSIVSFISKQ